MVALNVNGKKRGFKSGRTLNTSERAFQTLLNPVSPAFSCQRTLSSDAVVQVELACEHEVG